MNWFHTLQSPGSRRESGHPRGVCPLRIPERGAGTGPSSPWLCRVSVSQGRCTGPQQCWRGGLRQKQRDVDRWLSLTAATTVCLFPMANILVTMTKPQILSHLKPNHSCLLCESKSPQAFTSLSVPGRVISWQSRSSMWSCVFSPASCHLFSLLCWDRLLTIAQAGVTPHGQPPALVVGGTDIAHIC